MFFFTYKRDSQGFYVTPNFEYVLKTYGSNIKSDLVEILNFEQNTDDNIFDEKSQKLNFDVIAKKIKECEEHVEKFKDDKDSKDLYLNWLSFDYFYYSALFNPSDAIFFDAKTNKYKDSVLKQYDELVAANPDSQLSKDVQGYIDIIKKNNNQTSKESDNYLNKINEKFLEITTTNKSTNAKTNVNTNKKTSITSDNSSNITPKITIVQDK